jgi:hypothetical protein
MNCTVLQRRLLALEDPHRPPAELRAHLAHCPACRVWQSRLVEIEGLVPLLEVPPSAAKGPLIDRILNDTAVPRRHRLTPLPTLSFRSASQRRDIARMKAALATALVASLAAGVILLVFANWPEQPGKPGTEPAGRDPLLAKLLQEDVALAKGPARPERLKILNDLARDLEGETQALTQDGTADDLRSLKTCYEQVMQQGVGPLAPNVPPEVRAEVADRLENAWQKLAEQAGKVSDERGPPLRAMAEAAGQASRALRGKDQADRRPPRPDPSRPVLALGAPARGVLPAAVPAAALALFAEAASAATPPDLAEQARHFQRNRGLVTDLVDGGVSLAKADEPLGRAECCNRLAKTLATEISLAAGDREGDRVADLGAHLQALLKVGVADNLRVVRAQSYPGSASREEKQLQHIQHETDTFVDSLETALKAAGGLKGLDCARGAIRAWKEWEKAPPPKPGD